MSADLGLSSSGQGRNLLVRILVEVRNQLRLPAA